MHLFPFPISRKSHRNHHRLRKRHRNHMTEPAEEPSESLEVSSSSQHTPQPSESPPKSSEVSSSLQHTSEWPPLWKAVEESSQFECGMLQRFMREWKLEKADPIDDSKFPPNRRGVRVKNSHDNLKTFLRQVRASRGYDVDVRPPEFMRSPFTVLPLSRYMKCENVYKKLRAKLNFVIAEINSQAETHNKMDRLELHEIEKVVEAFPHRTTLVTFSVKEVAHGPNVIKTVQAMVYNDAKYNFELKEWRFKPHEEEKATTH